jgi:hypothetical protein
MSEKSRQKQKERDSFWLSRAVSREEVPPHLSSDYCLRCLRPFLHGEAHPIVKGNQNARYRDIAIHICRDCMAPEVDEQTFFAVYYSAGPLQTTDRDKMRPIFTRNYPLAGYLRLNLLETGFWRVGLHRGHAEVWTAEDVGKYGHPPGQACYTKDGMFYGSLEAFPRDTVLLVVSSEFLDLGKPTPLRGGASREEVQ